MTTPQFTPLPFLGLLRFSGNDARTYLQGQISNDTRLLAASKTLLAAYSSPQGRVEAVLQLLPHSSGDIAIVPRELLLPTLERLRKFVMRAKVKIEDVGGEFELHGEYAPDCLAARGLDPGSPGTTYWERDGVGVGQVAHDPRRFWVIEPTATPAVPVAAAASGQAAAHNDWRLADIRAGVPQVYAATREMFVAQMLNLDLIDGISFSKGCYTGQEIIARTQHLGRIKRRLHRLRLPSATWAIGQAITLSDGRSGRITELAEGAEGTEALAVLSLAADDPPEAAADVVAAVELPLPYLQRPAA